MMFSRLALITSCLLLGCAAGVRVPAPEPKPLAHVDSPRLAATLAAAVQIPTVAGADVSEFVAMEALLRRSFPMTFDRLDVQVFPGGSLLLEWPGAAPARAPYLLLAHLDVVPVESGTEDAWIFPPFSGAIEDGYVWGRGTLDCKTTAITTLTAVEGLLASGFTPERTVFLAFGADEEVGGKMGAAQMAASLRKRSLRFLFTLDEGNVIVSDIMPGLKRPAAIIGVAEKGYVTFRLTARAPGGHSSMPPPSSAAGRLARAVVAVEDSPMPAHLEGPTRQMLETLAPHLEMPTRLAIRALPLSTGLILQTYDGAPELSAQVRTTTAVTMMNSGTKENILPQRAEAVVNFRLRPGDTVADVADHLHKVIADPGIEITRVGPGNEASPVAALDSPGYLLVAKAIESSFPEALVVPGLVVGATDTRHYVGLADASLRFGPMRLGPKDLSRIHGTNERIAVTNLTEMVRFYRQLILDADVLPASN
jgi:carboxypeptidase PM20D1